MFQGNLLLNGGRGLPTTAFARKIFCLSEQGDTYVLKAGLEYELPGVNSLGEFCPATLAIIGERLILRTETILYSIRELNTGEVPNE